MELIAELLVGIGVALIMLCMLQVIRVSIK
jgi:hypothetical protein